MPQEGTASSFSCLAEVIGWHGGRCERAFCKLRDRPHKKLTPAGIRTVAANPSLREVCRQERNARFATTPDEPGSALVQVREELWRDVVRAQEKRRVGNDHCLCSQGRIL